MGEPYLRPPLVAREPTPRWVGVWRFRFAALAVLLLLTFLVLHVVRGFVQTEQDPGIGAPAPRDAVMTAPAD